MREKIKDVIIEVKIAQQSILAAGFGIGVKKPELLEDKIGTQRRSEAPTVAEHVLLHLYNLGLRKDDKYNVPFTHAAWHCSGYRDKQQ